MKPGNRYFVIFSAILLLICVFAGCGQNPSKAEKVKIEQSYAIDVDNPRELVGFADYAFVAQVKDKRGVEDLSDEREMPYTIYGVEVLQNVKGTLKQGVTFPLEKAGGYSKAENAIYEYEEDYLPKEGDICIFYACAADDGELIVSGANSTVKLGEAKVQEGSAAARDAWKKEKAYEILVEAAKHPILTDRVRSISSYDAE